MTGKLVEAVEEDPSLSSVEKETTIRFSKDDDTVSIYSEEASIIRRLLHHPYFEVDELLVNTDGAKGRRVNPNDFNEGSITGIDGSLPIGALAVQPSLRDTSKHSEVISEAILRGEATAD
jgi:hypothetical protein